MQNEIQDQSIDLVFADPPYGFGGRKGIKFAHKKYKAIEEDWDDIKDYLSFTKAWISECHRVLKPAGAIYVCCCYKNIKDVLEVVEEKFKVLNIIVWYKTNAPPNVTNRMFAHSTEFIVFGVKGKGWKFNAGKLKELAGQQEGRAKQMRDMWSIPFPLGSERLRNSDGKVAHPCQKPERLVERAIVASSDPGDVVLDPFCGSGTTIVVADRLDRQWIGIEIGEEYIQLIKKRLEVQKKQMLLW